MVHAAGDQWLRRPALSDLKVIVVDIDCASIDALGTGPWPRETMARLVEAVALRAWLNAAAIEAGPIFRPIDMRARFEARD